MLQALLRRSMDLKKQTGSAIVIPRLIAIARLQGLHTAHDGPCLALQTWTYCQSLEPYCHGRRMLLSPFAEQSRRCVMPIIKLLLEVGADAMAKHRMGCTALDVVIAKLLRSKPLKDIVRFFGNYKGMAQPC